ncbi:hypothetical protein [Halorubrum laminariae]|uniref:Helix-hairpin-helix domain-containing protein n=1 Tax=Halorubrum laminariae TaxID=1433523 RepID=A0ABD6C0G8_9EURY|nr:hypothetical protein [Halorubrum laminariae]
MIDTENPAEEQQPQSDIPECTLPETVSGWTSRTTKPGNILEYWRKGSTHIACSFEQLVARQRSDGDITLVKRCYDKYRHLLNTQTISQHDPSNFDWICDRAKERMERYPGIEPFTGPPTFPTGVGEWDAVSLPKEQPIGLAKWEFGLGRAELFCEETEIITHYSHTRRPHTISYRELDTESTTIAKGVSKTMAYEIAVSTLESLPRPVSEMGETKSELQEIKGIGPAKSRDLILLGVTSREQLREHIQSENSPINHHHSKAVSKLLTETIEDDLTTTDQSK